MTLVVAACGGSDEPSRSEEPGRRSGDGPQHIHGLGINPADHSLVIATHTGLFRAAATQRRAMRVADSYQDTMGFTVVGPHRFLASGHPDLQTDLPPLLGLIASDDAGRSWQPVSLLGKADFHVLRAAGRRVYGVNATDGQLFSSHDGGRRWSKRQPPGAIVDLVPDPQDPDRVIASGERELYVSRDAGRSWRPRARDRAGLLVWTRSDALFVIGEDGAVHRSSDAGGTWQRVGDIGGRPSALAARGSHLYVALHSNEVKVSRNDGQTWHLRIAA